MDDGFADAQVVQDRTTKPMMRAAPRVAERALPTWLLILIIGVLALVPRCLGLADFFTLDEANSWVKRVDRFSDALAAHNWGATVITGHPGVTVMWLGTLGRWAGHVVGIGDPGWGGGASYLALLRLPVAIVNSLAVVAGYILLRRLLRADVALLAGVLWATSPFIVAHSRLLHLDGLVTSFITLSLLLLLQVTTDDRRLMTDDRRSRRAGGRSSVVRGPWSFVGSGVCAGLALLTKAPSLVWLPIAGLIMFAAALQHWRAHADGRASFASMFVALLGRYGAWLGCAALTVLALWPALWVAPLTTVGIVVNEIVANGGEPHALGNYFAGQSVADPGWLFYPAVVLWRTTPITLIGLLLLVATALYNLRNRRPPITDHRPPTTTLCLVFFVLMFGIVLAIEPKKFDRYLLPVWPALEILAALGWVRLFDLLRRPPTTDHRPPTTDHRPIRVPTTSVLGSWFLVLVAVVSIGTLAWFHPYYLAYFNPLVGGSATGQRVMQVGWGEGQEYVGAWLRARPDIKKSAVYTWDPAALGPFILPSTEIRDLRDNDPRGHSGYAVLYVRNTQRQDDSQAIAYIRQTAPLYTLHLHGVDYASVHQLPFPFQQASDAVFGDGLHLRGFTQRVKGDTLTLTPSWDVQTTQSGGTFCFVHVLDASGRVVAQVDQPLDQGTFVQWQAGQQLGDAIKLSLDGLPAGAYRVTLGLYTPASSARIPLRQGQRAAHDIDGPEVIQLMTLSRPS